ncbi:MAG: hypothetical protein IJX84_11445 [Clostridia bacterium]|nr:hypothetical protein [Clostridia bacterium]
MTMVGTTLGSAMYPYPVQAAETVLPGDGRHGRVVMYAYDGGALALKDEHAHLVDQLNYSFALIEDGEATGDHWRSIDQVEAYLRRNPHIDGVVSVGGWGADGFSDACATPEGRQKLANSILRLMDDHGFVGVDIDWEYPGSSAAGIVSRPEDEENWYQLLALLRAGLDERRQEHGRDYLLSVAVGCGEDQLQMVDGGRLDELVDQVVLMTYDLSGFDKITGHHAGLYPNEDRHNSGARAVNQLADSGLSEGKMLLGFPSYARVWRQVTGGGNGLNQRAATSGNKTIDFDDILMLEGQGYTPYYDEEACAAWWFDGSSFVSGESQRSIEEKVAWLRDRAMLGCAVWSWNSDANGNMMAMLDAALRR